MEVLTLADHYLPGFKAGGPVRTIVGMVERLEGRHRFSIVTRDRDLGDSEPYRGIVTGAWTTVGGSDVLYLSPEQRTLRGIASTLSTRPHDVLYCNSFFSPTFTLKPLWLRRTGRIPRVPLVVAPRGEFAPAALSLKRIKKRAFLEVARAFRLYGSVVWQASSAAEEADIRTWFGGAARVLVAPNLPWLGAEGAEAPRRAPKQAGRLRVVFLARVSRMKNLKGALELLEGLEGDLEFDICGPIEDAAYWAECEKIARRLAPAVRVRHLGLVPHHEVARILAEHDLFFLPTLGENFGHAILEALGAGCPVLISDRTPWRGLETSGVGWDLPLDDPSRFRDALRCCVGMDAGTHEAWSRRAREFGLSRGRDGSAVEANARLFEWAAREA